MEVLVDQRAVTDHLRTAPHTHRGCGMINKPRRSAKPGENLVPLSARYGVAEGTTSPTKSVTNRTARTRIAVAARAFADNTRRGTPPHPPCFSNVDTRVRRRSDSDHSRVPRVWPGASASARSPRLGVRKASWRRSYLSR